MMNTSEKNYRDEAEIDLAWAELIQALKPMKKDPVENETKNNTAKPAHYPAIITTNELSHWETFG